MLAFFAGRHRFTIALAIVAVAFVVFLVAVTRWQADSSRNRSAAAVATLKQARAALQRGDFVSAEKIASLIDRSSRDWAEGRLVAGEAATRSGRPASAAEEYYRAIPRDGSRTSVVAALALAELARRDGRLSAALSDYEYVLKHEPDNVAAHARVAFLLGLTGQRWESLPHFMFLVRHRAWSLNDLAVLGDLERPLEGGDYLDLCVENAPSDPLVWMALASNFLYEGRPQEAEKQLRRVTQAKPELVAAHAMLGELLVDSDDRVFAAWHDGLPPSADASPDVWYVRGLWTRRKGELEVAARCFWETVRLAPTHRRGGYQLGQVLVTLGKPGGQEFLERSSQLFELSTTLDTILKSEGRDESAFQRAVRLTEATGRLWEACAWAGTAADLFPGSTWHIEVLDRLLPTLDPQTPRVLASADLARKFDYSGFAGPHQLIAAIARDASSQPTRDRASQIRFDASADAGINFTYFGSPDPATKGVRVFEQTGGGVAALDIDADGWMDLYFCQGTEWAPGANAPSPTGKFTDGVFRNLGDRYVEITRHLGLDDRGFGQGCAAGDFDNDGFTDLYVANIGRNVLYRNNGDGTFSDSSNKDFDDDAWTASCVMVDLNADGLADLFDVNYLEGENVYTAICEGHACSPVVFGGSRDRLYLNEGDGSFKLLPEATPAEGRDSGKGLGVLAFALDALNRPNLFIANDQVPNYFLRNDAAQSAGDVRLSEDGLLSGLAYNDDGLTMACMGIAADDADGNGLLDFYVTNFSDESNSLYLQDVGGLFVDATKPAGLVLPSLPFVGWGTQFLDADLDGHSDLVVANGHVDDYRDEGGMYHMRPQFYRNLGDGRFAELLAEEAGSYFSRAYLGRGLARLDWNRDGRMDFAVSHIGEPASLVTNQSVGVGHFLTVRLKATTTNRDAICAVVDVTAGGRTWRKQLTAGDGYMASNERFLQFGLGSATTVDELVVTWPSGARSRMTDLPADADVILIEGQSSWRQRVHPRNAASVPEELAVR